MNEAEIRYSNQSRQLNRYGVTFCKDTAARLVGEKDWKTYTLRAKFA